MTVALSHPRHLAPASNFDAQPKLAHPGDEDYPIPRISWRMNGFSFWPFAGAPREAKAPGFEVGRVFQVRAPAGEFSSCFVGVTPHVRSQIEADLGHQIPENDAFWDKVCGQTLLQLIATRPQTPPDILPVYEAPKTSASARGGIVTWGAFFGE